jgi:hypothetical protein
MQQANRLGAFTDDDLFNELCRRSASAVLIMHIDDGETATRMRTKWHGSTWSCLGMAQQFVHDMLNKEYGEPL